MRPKRKGGGREECERNGAKRAKAAFQSDLGVLRKKKQNCP